MELEWKPIKNMTSNPESIYVCPTCIKEIFCHVNYINAGIPACIRKGCGNPDELSKRMVEYRRWKFISTEKSSSGWNRNVNFSCENGHDCSLTFKSLKKGGICMSCYNLKRKKQPINSCKNQKKCLCSSLICEHYNHGILYPDSASEWSDKNEISVFKVSPGSDKKYLFDCLICGVEYEQSLYKRSIGQRCPYCNGTIFIPFERSLEYNSPHLAKEWSNDNVIKPSEIANASNKNVWWECSKCNHKWNAAVRGRVCDKKGCPRCNCSNYDAMVGGHDYFIKRVKEIHGNKYTYIGIYQNNYTKIDILCNIHGIFSQEPYIHLSGSGCPSCYYDTHLSKGEERICVILDELKVEYQKQKKFPELCHKQQLKCDFYLPKFNLIVEYDGKQHFGLTGWSSDSKDRLNERKYKDLIKDLYMVKNKINLLRIPYTRYTQIKDLIVTAINRTLSSHVYTSYPQYIVKIGDQISLDGIMVVPITSTKLILVA